MLFVLSASLRFFTKPPVVETACRSTPKLQAKARALAQELRKLEAKDIKKQLHLNDALAKQYAQHLGNFEGQQPLPACCLYDSKLYHALDAPSLDQEDSHWANQHIRIFSGLYGLLRPYDEIQPLSLPVGLSTKLTNSKGKFLRDYWKEHIRQELYDSLLKLHMPVIIDMSGEEESVDMLDLDALPDGTFIQKVDFKTANADDAKPAQGEFIRWAMENRCMTIEELLEFQGLDHDGHEAGDYRLNPKASTKDRLVFEEAVGEGGGGGWSKKMAESGMSKRSFIKVNASNKNRYLRTEINKSLIKENKKNRKRGDNC